MALQLYAHQKESVAFASKLKAFFDASDPGTGKTAVQIELFRRRRKGRKGGKCALVIAPKSLLRPAWFMDFQKFAPELKCSIAYADNREEAFATEADVYITNTDAAVWLAKQNSLTASIRSSSMRSRVSNITQAGARGHWARSRSISLIVPAFRVPPTAEQFVTSGTQSISWTTGNGSASLSSDSVQRVARQFRLARKRAWLSGRTKKALKKLLLGLLRT